MVSVKDLKYLEDIQRVLEPLKLDHENVSLEGNPDDGINGQVCLLCSKSFDFDIQKPFLQHLFEVHRLVIADVHDVADLQAYIKYWKVKFADKPLEEYCTTMLLDQKPDGTVSKDEKYYLLSDVIGEDKTLRIQLQQNRLEKVLEQHRIERSDDTFKRECWFCHLNFEGTRYGFVEHLSTSHNLQLGAPEKLVYVTELIDKIEEKLNSLHCIYCEKVFKDRIVLKEHMRKKLHKRVNPDDKSYDKYYLINYRELGKTWQNFAKKKVTKSVNSKPNPIRRNLPELATNADSDEEGEVNSDENWSEWDDKFVDNVHCLFCNASKTEFDEILDHMKDFHEFPFKELTDSMSFYERMKLVNYIRRQIYLKNCIFCDINFDTIENLQKHMAASRHFKIPDDDKTWNQVLYMFPTYEDDTFLCYLDDVKDEIELIDDVTV